VGRSGRRVGHGDVPALERPRARAGGRHRTPAGVLAVDAMAEVDPAAISEGDARAAGFGSLAEAVGRERLAFTTDVRKLKELG
jgi:hypothetical protein